MTEQTKPAPQGSGAPATPADNSRAKAFAGAPKHASLHDALVAVARDLALVGVGKNLTVSTGTSGGSYQARGIVGVMDAVGYVFALHGIIVTPVFEYALPPRDVPTQKGGTMTRVNLKGCFTYRHGEESTSCTVLGEASDYGDKATSKAMSVCAKYAHGLVLSIPYVGMEDNENDDGKDERIHTPRNGDQARPVNPMTDVELSAIGNVIAAAANIAQLKQYANSMLEEALSRSDPIGASKIKEMYSKKRRDSGWPITSEDKGGAA